MQGSSPAIHFLRRLRALFGAAAAASVLLATAGRARAQETPAPDPDTTAEVCFSSAERAQPLLRQRRLREARALLESCARDECPRAARGDCRQWLAEANDAQPSIVIAAREVRGKATPHLLSGVRAVIDDTQIVDPVDRTPIPVDPGRHRIRLEREGAEPLVQNIEVNEGDKGRVLDLYWRLPEVMVPTRPVPASVYVLGALGVAGAGVGAYFEATGLSQRSDLDACKPSCASSQVSSARWRTAAGDMIIGGGAVLLGSALVLYLVRPVVDEPARTEQTSWALGVTPDGFYVGARGAL